MANITVLITTYNRPKMLGLLLNDIETHKNNHKIHTYVINDGSDVNYDSIDKKYNFKHIRAHRHGKWRYWLLVTMIFEAMRYNNDRYFIMVPDDVRLKDDFFDKAIKMYSAIKNPHKICLNLLLDKQRTGKTNWTNFISRKIKAGNFHLYHTQWVDMCFIAEKKFFDILSYRINKIPPQRWQSNGHLGSGVGQDISIRLNAQGLKMYQVCETLVIHGDHPSRMNTAVREQNPLTT